MTSLNKQIVETFKERSAKRRFINELTAVSGTLADWAQDKLFTDNYSIDDVKLHIKNAMKVCGRD